ncbi:protein kinase [Streptomyces sp. M41]|uniref:protein kinase domain-containing protein n=1 Tax=Streptomyces sp. M41 TaxID=3059412 RepID=UPI00374DCE56
MGRVWRAVDEVLDRLVAAKEMRIDGLDPEDTRTRRERTLREARATARIDHPNVVRVYDVVDEGERLWIVMELVAGRSLERIMAEEGPLTPHEAARIGLGLVAALRQVHARGVLHRDIKPGNVLVESQETRGRGRAVLTDFGIAAIQDAKALTMVGMLVGSPDYMAPERISGRLQGPPSDLWSLGATLSAALAGRSPFARDTTLATLHAVLYEEPELPPTAGPLRPLLAALLDKEPAHRPGLDDLESALEPVAFLPPTPTMPVAVVAAPPEGGTPEVGSDTGEVGTPAPTPPGESGPEEEGREPTTEAGPGQERTWPGSADSVRRPEPEPTPTHVTAPTPSPAIEAPDHLPSPATPPEESPTPALPEASRVPPHPDPRQPHPRPHPHADPPPSAHPDHGKRDAIPPTPLPHPGNTSPTADPDPSPRRRSGVSLARSEAVTEQRPAPEPGQVPGAQGPYSTAMPPGEPPGPAVPARPRPRPRPGRGRRRRNLVVAVGVAAAGAVVTVVLVTNLGAPKDDDRADGSSTAPSVSAESSPGSSPSSTVEGTSRPQSLPPGAHREAGGFAWAPPEGWRRNVKTGSEVHYTSPDGMQELAAKSSLARDDLMDSWQESEQNAQQGKDYSKIRLERTTFRGRPAVVWEYTFTLRQEPWHARLLGFTVDGRTYQINTWYHPDIEAQAMRTYEKVRDSFTVL